MFDGRGAHNIYFRFNLTKICNSPLSTQQSHRAEILIFCGLPG